MHFNVYVFCSPGSHRHISADIAAIFRVILLLKEYLEVFCFIVLFSFTVLYSVSLCCILVHCVVFCFIVLYSVSLFCILVHCVVL